MAMYAKGEFAGFQYNGIKNAWNLKRYSFTNITYPVPSDFVGKTLIAEHIIMDSDTSISLNLGDNYSAIATAYIEFDEDTTITCNVTTDDGGTVTLNDVLIKNQCVSCRATSVTFNFKKGWNKVEICYQEGVGGDGFTTATKFSTVAKNMYTEMPTPVTLTYIELGKVYDWDGTTSHQLGKGYDYDGTTSHLIYSAEQIIFYNGAQGYPVQTYFYKNEGTSGGFNTNNNKITIYSNGSQYQVGFYTVGANIKFNLTGAKYIKALINQGYESRLWITTQAPTSGDGAQGFYNNSPAKIKTIGATQKEISLDISAISGEYYIVISCIANYNATSWLEVFKWWIEY